MPKPISKAIAVIVSAAIGLVTVAAFVTATTTWTREYPKSEGFFVLVGLAGVFIGIYVGNKVYDWCGKQWFPHG